MNVGDAGVMRVGMVAAVVTRCGRRIDAKATGQERQNNDSVCRPVHLLSTKHSR